MKLEPPPLRQVPMVRTDPAMPRLPPPPRRPQPDEPLFDQLSEWAARDEHRPAALALGFGLFCASTLWLLYALR